MITYPIDIAIYGVTNFNIISVIVLMKFQWLFWWNLYVWKRKNRIYEPSPPTMFLIPYRKTMEKICDVDSSLIGQNENSLYYALLFGKENMNDSKNAHILNATIEYILSTERFNAFLFE